MTSGNASGTDVPRSLWVPARQFLPPLPDLGLIILDEEQESSYQSESMVRYHAREVAKFRCKQHKGLLLLGSATPAVESRYAAETGQYHLFTLQQRYNAHQMPKVVLADMKQELRA